MKVSVGYSATSSVDVWYDISYKCCSCGAENTDKSQSFTVKKVTTGFNAMNTGERAREGLNENLQYAIQEKQEAIRNRDYCSLKLGCSCSQCKKKQPWSSHWPLDASIFPVRFLFEIASSTEGKAFLCLLLFIVGIAFFVLISKLPKIGLPILAVLLLPSAVAAIHNVIMRIKTKKLPEENLPNVEIILK